MTLPDRGDHTDVGSGDAGQSADLTRLVRPELQHDDFRVLRDVQQREGHADPVVPVALGGMDPSAPCQRGSRHLLRRRLAGRSGDGDHRHVEGLPAVRGEGAQRLEGVTDRVHGEPVGAFRRAGDDRPRSPPRGRIGHEVVTIEAIAQERHVQVTRTDRAGVGGNASIADRVVGQLRAKTEGSPHLSVAPPDAHRPSPISARHSRTTSRSSKGSFSVPIV